MGRISYLLIALMLISGSADAATVVGANAAITGATKTKITYDTKGLVTSGADAAVADISGLQTALDGKFTLVGLSGGQTAKGDTAPGGNLTLMSTAHTTKGKILFGTSAYDEVNNRLGVGTASPETDVHISRSVNGAPGIGVTNAGTGTGSRGLMFFGEDTSVKNIQFSYQNNTYNAGVGYESLAANGATIYAHTGATAGLALVAAANAPVKIFTGGFATANERIRILGTGNVGINTATPNAKLEVKGTGTTTGVNFQLLDSAAAAKFTVLDNGVVINSNVNRLKNYTVATLPAGTQGDTAFVTDALAPTYLSTVVGGGAVVTPVFYNGTNWVGY